MRRPSIRNWCLSAMVYLTHYEKSPNRGASGVRLRGDSFCITHHSFRTKCQSIYHFNLLAGDNNSQHSFVERFNCRPNLPRRGLSNNVERGGGGSEHRIFSWYWS